MTPSCGLRLLQTPRPGGRQILPFFSRRGRPRRRRRWRHDQTSSHAIVARSFETNPMKSCWRSQWKASDERAQFGTPSRDDQGATGRPSATSIWLSAGCLYRLGLQKHGRSLFCMYVRSYGLPSDARSTTSWWRDRRKHAGVVAEGGDHWVAHGLKATLLFFFSFLFFRHR